MYVAGRKEQIGVIDASLARITSSPKSFDENRSAALPVVFTGPRGVGKTVLLGIAEEKACGLGANVITASWDGKSDAVGDPEHAERTRGLFKRQIKSALSSPIFKRKSSIGGFVTLWQESIDGFKEAMMAGLKKGPLYMEVDEAHCIPSETLGNLCVAAHELAMDGKPLALFLAGTPGLHERLVDQGRGVLGHVNVMRFYLLSPSETVDAIAKGFETQKRRITDKALDSLVEESGRYTYFTQLLGDYAWKAASDSGNERINLADAREGIKDFRKRREELFYWRYNQYRLFDICEQAVYLAEYLKHRKAKATRQDLVRHMESYEGGLDGKKAARHVRELLEQCFMALHRLGWVKSR